jgi:hypothetical protein
MLTTMASQTSIIFAFIAAILWFWSATASLPVIGSAYGEIANLAPFYAAMKKVARLNAGAALSAFVSASARTSTRRPILEAHWRSRRRPETTRFPHSRR